MSTLEASHDGTLRVSYSTRRRVWPYGVALVLVALAAAGAWHFFGPSSSAAKPSSVGTTVANLEAIAKQVHHPVYWAGRMSGHAYELTMTKDGRIYIRYLPSGVEVGDPRPAYTTVGTYPRANAYATLSAGAKAKGATYYKTQSGALVVVNKSVPNSVYFAFPKTAYLMEVYDPSPSRALNLVLSGSVKLVP